MENFNAFLMIFNGGVCSSEDDPFVIYFARGYADTSIIYIFVAIYDIVHVFEAIHG